MVLTSVPDDEIARRIEAVRERLAESNAEALCLFSATAIEWVSGFHHLQTERPVCLAVTEEAVHLTIPQLEGDRAESGQFPAIDRVHSYYDYPGGRSESATYYLDGRERTPESVIADMLDSLGVSDVAADMNGAPGFWGYAGPALDEFADVSVTVVDWVGEFRLAKSEVEQELLRESAKWGNLAHKRLETYASPGEHELWVAKRASLDASMQLLDTLGPRYDSHLRGGLPASVGFLSGPNTARPHGLTANRRLERGDVLVTGATANIGGYVSELERTMFLGDVDEDHRHRFEQMREMQQRAIDACGPGVPVAAVDQAAHDYASEQGIVEYTSHHTGHNIGLEGHEPPFVDRGSDAVMQPGHAYTIEPAIVVPDVAGYRHSDTILITDDGVEELTYYPRDLESCIIGE